MVQVFLSQVQDEEDNERYEVGKQGRPMADDLGDGLRGAPADPAGFVAQQPDESPQVLPDVIGIILGNAAGGDTHGLDCPPSDQRVRVESKGNEGAQYAPLLSNHHEELVEISVPEQFAQALLHR